MNAPVSFEAIAAGDPRLRAARDPGRSRSRLLEARLDGPVGGRERERVLGLLDSLGETLADRTTAPAHLTGSALVVDAAHERVLVLLHAKLRRWLQPGGHADGDHELAGVALREAGEETGIPGLQVLIPAVDLDVHAVDHGDALGEHLHLDLRFVVVAPPGAVGRRNHESLGLRWVTREELDAVADEPGLIRLAEAGLAALRERR